MLQLAQKTNGVIVTNDNMRDLFDESDDFKDIIRKRFLNSFDILGHCVYYCYLVSCNSSKMITAAY